MKWFKNVSNIEELKSEYKKLAKKWHPDMNSTDTTKQFVEINAEYDKLFQVLKNKKSENAEKHAETSNFKSVIDKIIQFEEINVEITGTWVWVSGNTYSIRQNLKDLGFKWSKSNKKWYWTEQELSKKRKKAQTWEYKVEKFGLETVKSAKKVEKTRIPTK